MSQNKKDSKDTNSNKSKDTNESSKQSKEPSATPQNERRNSLNFSQGDDDNVSKF